MKTVHMTPKWPLLKPKYETDYKNLVSIIKLVFISRETTCFLLLPASRIPPSQFRSLIHFTWFSGDYQVWQTQNVFSICQLEAVQLVELLWRYVVTLFSITSGICCVTMQVKVAGFLEKWKNRVVNLYKADAIFLLNVRHLN